MSATDRDARALLRVSDGADRAEIDRAYRELQAVYAPGSITTYGLLDDGERQRLLDRIHDAYRSLTGDAAPPEDAAAPSRPPTTSPLPDRTTSPGGYLRALRERRGTTLDEVSDHTKIRRWLLEQIEAEAHDNLPAPVYVRGFVRQIASMLGADEPDELARVYLDRMG